MALISSAMAHLLVEVSEAIFCFHVDSVKHGETWFAVFQNLRFQFVFQRVVIFSQYLLVAAPAAAPAGGAAPAAAKKEEKKVEEVVVDVLDGGMDMFGGGEKGSGDY